MHLLRRSPGTRPLAAALLGALTLGVCSAASGASNLNEAADFYQIAKNGFGLTVDGAFPNLEPNLGTPENTYAWSMAWFQGALWVGTNRNFGALDINTLAERGGSEIWRYKPSAFNQAGDWGRNGTWKRVYKSPSIRPIIALLSQGILPSDTPRDFGYRNMSVCNAGDRVQRLYATTIGIPGNILYYDGQTFQTTNDEGLFNNLVGQRLAALQDPASVEVDLGYRALACFKGRLWTSPAGSFQDVDTSLHPVVHMNPDPANGAAWQTVVDVSDPASTRLADPGNIGIFQIAVMGDYLWLITFNRCGEQDLQGNDYPCNPKDPEDTGFELWRGDGHDCLEPWAGDGHCNMHWAKIIDNGGGRPADLPLITSTVDNAGGTLGVFGNDLYIGAAESGFSGSITAAELMRVPNAGSVPPGGRNAPHEWELISGSPRLNYAKPDERLPGLENLHCTNVGDVPNTKADLPQPVQDFWDYMRGFVSAFLSGQPGFPADYHYPYALVDLHDTARDSDFSHYCTDADNFSDCLDDDDLADDCLPAFGSGPGMPFGENPPPAGTPFGPPYDPPRDPLSFGNASYFWRFGQHQGDLFVGTLDVFGGVGEDFPRVFGEAGFDLLKTADGTHFSVVADNGLGNPNNFGGRSLLSTPIGLALGTANSLIDAVDEYGDPAGGTEIFIGTTIAPKVAISFPADGGSYVGSHFASGCGSAAADICGTASDPDPEQQLQAVKISIQRVSDGAWWDGGQYSAAAEPVWLPATGTTSWSYGFTPEARTEYRVQARASNKAGLEGDTAPVGFSYYASLLQRFFSTRL